MGTRSMTIVKDEQGKRLFALYRQYDGYPEGAGAEVASFLAGKEVVNGFGGGDTTRQFNGAGDLGARLVAFLKNVNVSGGEAGHDAIGSFYFQHLSDDENLRDSWVEYVYEIEVEEGQEPRIIFTDLNTETTETAAASEFATRWGGSR